MIALRRVMVPAVVLSGLVLQGCPPTALRPCCGDLSRTPLRPQRFFQQISTNAGEVPVELQGCGANGEEITAISLNGTLAGCSTIGAGARITFTTLDVEFATNGQGCPGGRGVVPHRPVSLRNVEYTASIRPGPRPCITSSSVTGYTFHSDDPAFATLFATRGPQTLLPILDRFALGWAASPLTCPPTPILGGVVSRCPG